MRARDRIVQDQGRHHTANTGKDDLNYLMGSSVTVECSLSICCHLNSRSSKRKRKSRSRSRSRDRHHRKRSPREDRHRRRSPYR